MKTKTNVKAGGVNRNHNETLSRDMKAKTNVRAGGVNIGNKGGLGLLFFGVLAAFAAERGPARFAYVVNQLSNNVSAYNIDVTTGALTPVPGSPFPAGTRPSSVTVDPRGQFVYVTLFTLTTQRSHANFGKIRIDRDQRAIR